MTEKRKISAKNFRWITSELEALEAKGLDSSVAEQIREMYDPPQEDPRRWEKRVFFTVCAIAVLWLGLSLFLIISHNWNLVSPQIKVASALICWALSWGALFIFRKSSPIVSELLSFLTVILYGVGLWQVAQVFHFGIGYSEGFWFWGIGAWLISLTAQSLLLPTLSTALLVVWSFVVVGNTSGAIAPVPIWGDYFYGVHFPNLFLTILFVSIVGWFYFRRRSPLTAQLYYYLLCFWLIPILIQYEVEHTWPWILALWSGAWLAVRYFLMRKPLYSIELMVLAFALLVISVYDYHIHVMYWPSDLAILATIVASVLLIFLAIALIRTRGHWAGRSYFTGIFLFLIWGAEEYIDLFGKRGYISTALVFFHLALFFFVAATIWYRRTKKQTKTVPCAQPDEDAPRWWTFFDASRYSKWFLLLAIFFQCGTFCYQIIPMTWGFRHAKEITVRTRLYDPRSLVRGDYVQLGYDFSQLETSRYDEDTQQVVEEQNGRSIDSNWDGNFHKHRGTVVFIALKSNGEHDWKTDRWSFYPIQPNGNEIVLRGRLSYSRVLFGIETFFVPEGKGKEIEAAMGMSSTNRQSRVIVTLLISPNGHAKIKEVTVLPPEEGEEAATMNSVPEALSSGEAIDSAAAETQFSAP